MKTMTEIAHQIISENTYDIAIDFTMGNGHDTLFLSKYAKQVYSFDIQETALTNTKELIKDKGNVQLILASHELFDEYVNSFDCGIFNLGYLPGGNEEITTKSSTTIKTLDKALKLLNIKGRIIMIIYPGHHEGLKESKEIEEYLNQIDTHQFNISTYKMLNKNNSPYLLIIEKHK